MSWARGSERVCPSGPIGAIVDCEAHDNNYTPATACAAGILIAGSDNVLVKGNVVDGNLCDILVAGDGNTLDRGGETSGHAASAARPDPRCHGGR